MDVLISKYAREFCSLLVDGLHTAEKIYHKISGTIFVPNFIVEPGGCMRILAPSVYFPS